MACDLPPRGGSRLYSADSIGACSFGLRYNGIAGIWFCLASRLRYTSSYAVTVSFCVRFVILHGWMDEFVALAHVKLVCCLNE